MNILELHCFALNLRFFFVLFLMKSLRAFNVQTAETETCEEGSKGVLRCTYTNKNPADTSVAVLWQKIDKKTGQSKILFNSLVNNGEKHSTTTRLKLVGAASIQISPVLMSDAGTYRCQITPLPSFDQAEAITELQVTYAPKFTIPVNTTLYLDNGDRAILPCYANGQPSNIIYTWYYQPLNGMEETLNTRYYRQLDYDDGKTLRVAFLGEHEGRFRCEANNSVGSSSVITYLILKRPARFVSSSCSNYSVIEGDKVVMTVEATGVPNNLTFKWFYNDVSILFYNWSSKFGLDDQDLIPQISIFQTRYVSRLEIRDVQRQLAGKYKCKVYNGVGSPDKTNLTLDVRYAAEFVAFPRKLYQVVENSSVSFPCNGVGIPAVTTEWQTSNQTLLFFNSSMPNRYQMLDNGNLVIESAERSDSGKFTCKISNDVGYPAIATSYLQVQYPPEIREFAVENYRVMAGSNFTIYCQVFGLPEPNVTWYKDFRLVLNVFLNTRSIALTNIDFSHAGEYRCQAENYLGAALETVRIVVLSPPQILDLPSLNMVDIGDDLNITCVVSSFPLAKVQWKHLLNSSTYTFISLTNGTRGRVFVIKSNNNSTMVSSTLILTRIGLQDLGTYQCISQNFLNKTNSSVQVILKKDFHLNNITVSSITSSQITTSWESDDMGMRILCQLWSLNAEKFLGTTKCFTNSCTIRNLNASTAYKLVFLANNFGRGSQELNTLAVKTEDIAIQIPSHIQGSQKISTTIALPAYSRDSNPQNPVSYLHISDVAYDPTTNCIRWKKETSSTKLHNLKSFSTIHTSSKPALTYDCVKVEIQMNNSSSLWSTFAQCIRNTSKVCGIPSSADYEVLVKLSACNQKNNVCLQFLEEKIKLRLEINATPILMTSQASSFPDWTTAAVGATLAATLFAIMYGFAYAYLSYKRRRQEPGAEFDFRRPRNFQYESVCPRSLPQARPVGRSLHSHPLDNCRVEGARRPPFNQAPHKSATL